MKQLKFSFLLLIITSFFILSACSGEEGNNEVAPTETTLHISEVNPFSGNEPAINEGKKLYEVKCVDCHGLDGEGGAGPDLRFIGLGKKKDNKKIFKIVYFGTERGMPTWKDVLGVEKIWKILAYVETLGTKKGRPNKSH